MKFENWKIETIAEILPREFYCLIETNRSHISKTFPVTVSSCENLENTIEFLSESKKKQEKTEGYFFYIRHTETKTLIGFVCVKNIDKKIKK